MADYVELRPVRATAWGEITSASDSGRLVISLLYADLGWRTIRKRGDLTERGASKTGEGLATAAALLTTGLFKGKNAKIPAGTQAVGRIMKDVVLTPR
ncbi:hypothetical protein ACFOWX_01170 [Sphingorhabdus arenilitoris]|uniref:Uncharacterized protein n=1 Tax=Sphingorhabdus arenilitoris TaxID=1490041 RepID=A0ABV8RCB3_9SPHN